MGFHSWIGEISLLGSALLLLGEFIQATRRLTGRTDAPLVPPA
jgi:hypothetical protein